MRYQVVSSFSQATEALAAEQGVTRVLAGGTDVLVQLKLGLVEPDLIIDIKGIPGVRDITETDDGFRIGAAVSGAELGEHAGLIAAWPGVVEAMELIGSTQVQGRATLVGNLCNASPAADSVPAMIAAGARLVIMGKDRARQLLVKDLLTGPGKTSLARDEVVCAVLLPARPENAGDAYLRFIPRTEMDIAVVGVAVSLTLADDGRITQAQVALGAVAPTARLVEDAAKALIGSNLDDDALDALAAACSAACAPIDDKRGTIEFRTKVAGVLACRAAKIAYQRAGGQL